MSRGTLVDSYWRIVVWQQFGAAIDMLGNAIAACPDELWSEPDRTPQWQERGVVGFWYLVFHTLFFLDYYLADSPTFRPPPPFTLDELDPAGILPDRPYAKAELVAYLEHCRARCQAAVDGLTDEAARRPSGPSRLELSRGELLLYNLRHVQHHTAQLNLLLRQATGDAPRWVGKAR